MDLEAHRPDELPHPRDYGLQPGDLALVLEPVGVYAQRVSVLMRRYWITEDTARYWVKLWSDWKEKKRRGIDTIADAS